MSECRFRAKITEQFKFSCHRIHIMCFPSYRKIVIKIGKKKKRKPESSEEESDDDPPPRHASKDVDSVRSSVIHTLTNTHKQTYKPTIQVTVIVTGAVMLGSTWNVLLCNINPKL